MNAARRKIIDRALADLRAVQDEEQSAYDNLPESIQASSRGDEFQENIDALEEACSQLDQIISARP